MLAETLSCRDAAITLVVKARHTYRVRRCLSLVRMNSRWRSLVTSIVRIRRRKELLLVGLVVAVGALAGSDAWASSNNESSHLAPAGSSAANANSIASVTQESDQNGSVGRGAMRNAQVIADRFGVSLQEILDFHSQAVGFGAMVKIFAIASITGTAAETLIEQLPLDADGEPDLDVLISSLSDEERAAFDALGMRGLGHLKIEAKGNAESCPPGLAKQERC